jgi:hypothetical protein
VGDGEGEGGYGYVFVAGLLVELIWWKGVRDLFTWRCRRGRGLSMGQR